MSLCLNDLNERYMVEKLKRYPPVDLSAQLSTLRRAGVLVPLFFADGKWSLLFTRRTDTVNDHKGQVSFPGGMAEPADIMVSTTAVREAWEEIGLKPSDVKIVGSLPDFHTVTDFLITPIVSIISWPFKMTLSHDEVARVFTIPLEWLIQEGNWVERSLTIGDRCIDNVVFYKDFDGEMLWGVTAKITLNLLEELDLLPC